MRHLLLIVIINYTFQSVFPFEIIRELFFPRNPILHRITSENLGRNIDESSILDFIGLVKQEGYPAEEHYLTTEDGYKLTFHRIPGSPKSPPKIGKPVVLLQHGVLSSSDSWVIMGAEKDLAFMLADQGYDVWVSNVRGNSYCRSHERLSPSNREFWDFSFHEIAIYDLAAIIDYSLNKTGQKKIDYIGHSMGTTMSYILLSIKPTYNDKIRLVVSLAPVALWKRIPDELFYKIVELTFGYIQFFLYKHEIYDLFPQADNNMRLINALCNNIVGQLTCNSVISSIAGSDPDQFDVTYLPYVTKYYPSGASVKTLVHYVQNINQGSFQQYDYGETSNYEIYGTCKPPVYNLEKVTAPTVLMYSGNDPLVREPNVFELSRKLANVIEVYKIPHKKFNHLDYIWARDVKQILYYKVLDTLISN